MTLDEMHQVLIANWNSVVKKHDKVWVLGDFAFGIENIALAGVLNGQKRLVLGNHDKYPAAHYLKYFLSVHGAVFWENCVLTHIPVHLSQLESRAKYNLHGHLHSKHVGIAGTNFPDNRYINVSCEQWNLTPVNADVILNGRETQSEDRTARAVNPN